MTKLPGSLRRGGMTFIMERWHARPALELLAREHMTTVAGVPTQLALMLRDPEFDNFDLSSVQYIIAGGGPITPGLAEEARAAFRCQARDPILVHRSRHRSRHRVRRSRRGRDRQRRASARERRARRSATATANRVGRDIGEVCLRSPAVMSGYWHDDEQTRAAFTDDGFVRTGDLGWIDDRGRLRLVGRSKEMYVRGGYNVYPVEIESVLSTHPDVAAVAIVPRPDDVMGEIGVAAVVRARPRTSRRRCSRPARVRRAGARRLQAARSDRAWSTRCPSRSARRSTGERSPKR